MGTDHARYRAAEQRLWDVVGGAPTEHRLRLHGAGVDVRVQEIGQGEPVLFIHGVGNSGTSWAPLAAGLPGFRCLLLDRPGCGLSARLDRTFDDVASFAEHAESLVGDVLDALEVDRAHVVATSLGGYFALRSAAAHPERIDRLVQLGWTVGAPIADTPLLMRLTAVRSIGRLMTRMPVSRRAARAMLARVGLRQALDAGRIPPEVVDWYRSQLNHTDTLRNEIDTAPPIMGLRHGVNAEILLDDDVLGRVVTPSLFLWGSDDPFGGESVARGFVPRIHGARLELLAGAGHAVWLDDPDRVAGAVSGFLAA